MLPQRLRMVMRDRGTAMRYWSERDNLVSEALAIDPERTAPAWKETTLIPEAPNAD